MLYEVITLSVYDARRRALKREMRDRLDRRLVVKRVSERIDDATEEGRADGDFKRFSRAYDFISLADAVVGSQKHATDVVFL